MLSKVGTFQKTVTTTGLPISQPVTGVGFQPNVLFVMTGGNNSSVLDTWTASAANPGIQVGVAVDTGSGIVERSLAIADDDNASIATAVRHHANDKVINYISAGTAASNVVSQADLASFDSDGFTLSWTKQGSTVALIFGYLALQVPDADIDSFNTAATGSGAITALGFDPVALWLMAANGTTYQTTAPTADAFFGLGAAAKNSGQFAAALMADNPADPTNTSGAIRSDRIFVMPGSFTAPSTHSNQISLTSFDTDGLTYNVDNYSAARAVEVLTIGGVSAYAETFAKATGAAPASNARTGYGFTPKAAISLTVSAPASTSSSAHIRFSLGFSDGTTQVALTVFNTDALGTVNSHSVLSTSRVLGTVTTDSPIIASSASIALDADGVTYTWNPNDANAHEVSILALGDLATPPGGTWAQIINMA